jgi:glycosyltransferase involved in cell wall biosynthesis
MKISMLMSVYGEHAIGGAERSAERVALGLQARGHQVHLVSLSSGKHSMKTRVLANGLAHTGVGLAQLYDPYDLGGSGDRSGHGAIAKALWHGLDVYNPVMGHRLQQVWSLHRPDLVVTQTVQGFSVSAWHAARQSGAALIHVLHDHALLCPGTAMTRGDKSCDVLCTSCRVYGRARHWCSQWPDAVAAPSHDVLNRHLKYNWFNEVPIQQVIENAIPESWPIASDAVQVAPGQVIRFAFLGRMDASKGVDTLLQAASKLPKGRFELHLAGPGEPQQVQALIEQYGLTGQAQWHGVVRAADFLAQQHVIVTPSRAHETFCNVVLEAACLGLPAIVSDRGALPERVSGGRSGWIFPVGDAQALSTLMQQCIDRPALVHEKGLVALDCRERNRHDVEVNAWDALCHQTCDQIKRP